MTLFCSRLWQTLAVLSLAFLFSANALAAAPAANSVIGNQATATYTDAGGQTQTVSSNVVETIVAQVFAVDLETGATIPAAPGQQVTFPHRITNNGNGTDTITVSAANIAGDNGDLNNIAIYLETDGDGNPDGAPIASGSGVTGTITLPAGASQNIVVVGTLPNTLVSTEFVDVQVTIVSSGDPNSTSDGLPDDNGESTSDDNLDKVTVSSGAIIAVTKSISKTQGLPGAEEYTVTLEYTNTGNATATDLVITDNLTPADTSADADSLAQAFSYVAESGLSSNTGATALTDATGNDEGGGVLYEFTSPNLIATIPSIPAGTTGNVTFKVTVPTGTVPGIIPNQASFTYDDGLDADDTNNPSNVSNEVLFTVLSAFQPDINPGDDTGHSLDGSGDANNTAISVVQGGEAVFNHTITNDGTAQDTINVTVALGDYPTGTTVQVFRASDDLDPANRTRGALLVDSNGDGVVDTGPLAPDAGSTTPDAPDFAANRDSINIQVVFRLPTNTTQSQVTAASGSQFDATVTVTSVNDPSKTDTATDSVNAITSASVDLTNNVSVADGATATDGLGTGAESSPVRINDSGANDGTGSGIDVSTATTTDFVLVVNNRGPQADSYNLLADDDGTFGNANDLGADASPAVRPLSGWSVQFFLDANKNGSVDAGESAITNTGSINAGVASDGTTAINPTTNHVFVIARISIPQNFLASNTDATAGNADDVYEIFFRAQSQSTNAVDIKLDAVKIAENPLIRITPNGNGSVAPGGSIAYGHTLANAGNTPLTNVNLGAVNSNSAGDFTTTLYLDLNGNGQADPTEPVITDNTIDIVALYTGTGSALIADLNDGVFNPGDQIPVVAVVNALPGTSPGESNTSTLTADANSPAGANPNATASDTTVVIGDTIRLEKEQSLDINCDGDASDTGEIAFTTSAITAAQGAIPSACIRYRITATNNSTQPVTDLVITDRVPDFTTLETSSCAAELAITAGGGGALSANGPGNVTAPLDAATGQVTANVSARIPASPGVAAGEFRPSQTAILTFCVQIDCSAQQIAAETATANTFPGCVD